MTQLADTNTYLTHFTSFAKEAANGHDWLDKMRRASIDRFEVMGFPTLKDEEWRFTDVRPLARIPFKPARPDEKNGAAVAQQFGFKSQAAAELVFVNGHFSRSLSKIDKLPKGIKLGNLAEALRSDAELIEQHLARHADIEKNPFVALNTGFINDGAFIHLARGTVLESPIHLLFVSTESPEPTVSHPRVLVIAEDSVQASIVESYVGTGGQYFTNAVTEIVMGQNTIIDHNKLQQESLSAYHVATTQVYLGRASNFTSHNTTLGGRLTRNDVNATIGGDGAYATLNGLVLIGGEQHADNHTLLDHASPNCPSHELYKHVLNGRASGVFKGKILVRQAAQKTDSKQTSKSLLLSDDATMQSMPALEIYADDVKCTHGSTTGPVDPDMLFYIRSRGVSDVAARHLLTYAFAADVTRRIKVEAVRSRIEDFMAAQHGLPQDLRITDLGQHDDAAL